MDKETESTKQAHAKSAYVPPEIRQIALKNQGMLCSSGGGFGTDPYHFGDGENDDEGV